MRCEVTNLHARPAWPMHEDAGRPWSARLRPASKTDQSEVSITSRGYI